MKTVTAWNKREDIDILEAHILCEWWCDIGYPDYRQSMVVLASDVGLRI